MNLLITGANGFIGKSLREHISLNEKFKVTAFGRNELDLLNFENTQHVLNFEKPDVIVNCAIRGGTRFDNDTQETFNQNILMYQNLKSLKSKFGCLINIGSGAEFDRSLSISRTHESHLFKRSPRDFYGKAKNEIARDVVNTQNFYNLRIFGCFGIHENENRFLKIVFNKNLKSETIDISDDKEMDFVHVNDLARVIEFMSENYSSQKIPKDINVVYAEKASLSEMIKMFIPINERNSDVRINSTSGFDYSGSSSVIDSIEGLNFSSSSLKTSLKTYYNELKVQRGSS